MCYKGKKKKAKAISEDMVTHKHAQACQHKFGGTTRDQTGNTVSERDMLRICPDTEHVASTLLNSALWCVACSSKT